MSIFLTIELLMLSGFPTGGDEGIRRLAPNPRGSNPLVTKPKKNAQFLRIAASMKCEFKEETRIKKARFYNRAFNAVGLPDWWR